MQQVQGGLQEAVRRKAVRAQSQEHQKHQQENRAAEEGTGDGRGGRRRLMPLSWKSWIFSPFFLEGNLPQKNELSPQNSSGAARCKGGKLTDGPKYHRQPSWTPIESLGFSTSKVWYKIQLYTIIIFDTFPPTLPQKYFLLRFHPIIRLLTSLPALSPKDQGYPSPILSSILIGM